MGEEKSFEEKLKRWLESEGIYELGTSANDMNVKPCGYWEKRWGGGKYTKAGLPDMHIVVNGVSVEAELKAPNGKPSGLQAQKLRQIDDAGCMGFVLYPKDFEAFKALVKHIKERWSVDLNAVTYFGLERGCKRNAI